MTDDVRIAHVCLQFAIRFCSRVSFVPICLPVVVTNAVDMFACWSAIFCKRCALTFDIRDLNLHTTNQKPMKPNSDMIIIPPLWNPPSVQVQTKVSFFWCVCVYWDIFWYWTKWTCLCLQNYFGEVACGTRDGATLVVLPASQNLVEMSLFFFVWPPRQSNLRSSGWRPVSCMDCGFGHHFMALSGSGPFKNKTIQQTRTQSGKTSV